METHKPELEFIKMRLESNLEKWVEETGYDMSIKIKLDDDELEVRSDAGSRQGEKEEDEEGEEGLEGDPDQKQEGEDGQNGDATGYAPGPEGADGPY